MRRSGESSQYHDETPRRRVRRPQSQDLEGLHINEMKGRAQEMAENSPTSPFKAGPFVLPQSPGSMQNPVSPHRLYSQHNPRSQSTGIPPSPHGYPHSAISPSRYPPGPPIYMSVPSPSSGISTPSCATPSSTTSIPSPDFFGPGMAEGTIPMSPSKSDPSYPIRSPSYYQPDHKPIYPESPQFNYPQGPSPGGTIHHLGYNRPVHGQTGFPSHPPPNTITPRMTSPSSTANLHPSQSPVYRTPQGVNPEHLPGNPSGRKFTNQPPLGKPPDSPETARLRQLVIEYYNNERENLKTKYYEKLQELFFLQNGGNLMDILIWKRRPNPQFTSFINSNKLEDGLVNLNVTPTSNPSSGGGGMWQQQKTVLEGNPEFTNVQRPGNEQAGPSLPANSNPSFYHEGFAPNVSPFTGNNMGQNIPALSRSLSMPNPSGMNVNSATSGNHINHQTGHKTNSVAHTNNTGSNPVINRSISVGGQPVANGPSNPSNTSVRTTSVNKNASVLSVLDNSFGSHEEIAVEAKKEAEVLKRVAELRKEGLWSTRRLPKVQEMSRKKAHWDYLLEEMQWLATDFAQERRWKRGVAKKLSRSVLKHHQEQRSKEVKAEKEETVRLRRIASSIAREVKQFWANVEKVVQYKVQSRLEEKRKKALDVQLNFIVDQTEKYSSWLAESLKNQPASNEGSTAPTSPVSSTKGDDDVDEEFDGSDQSDEEETILEEEELEEKEQTDKDKEKELELLQQDNEMTLEELLGKLPPEMLQAPSEGSINSVDSGDENASDSGEGSNESNESDIEVDVESKDKEEKKPLDVKPTSSKEEKSDADGDFVMTEDVEDDEQTLDEQEDAEEDVDHDKEIADLEKEGDMPLDELIKQYATGDDTTDFPSEEESSEESSEEEEAEEESGMEFLVRKDGSSDGGEPDQELTSAAATAESLQPTGFTLETAHVQTKVPMLLRGTLREYQVIGLDWLVTMHGKCLNGILADEMGLGKTIQTIALLAHLACDKSMWGPHLVVVPTSVMLNWEMEFKKWLPGFKILTYYGSQKERKAKRQGWTKPNAFHVCITSYKLVIQDHQAFRRKKWKYFILDEAQNIKNFKSQRWQYLLNFNSHRRLLLTGTPLQNSLMELWSLMHFLMPHLFQSHKDFKEWFSNPLTGMIEGSREYNENLVKRLHKVLRPFLLRRLKSEVEKQMPQKYEHVYRCRLSKRQRFLYDDFMSRTKTKETLESGHFLSVINILMQLRKVCNHPDLFEPRPTVSSLKLPGIVYYTSSLILRALDNDPFKKVNFGFLNLCLADIELSVTSYAAYRTHSLQTPKQLIVEINTLPDKTPLLVPPAKSRKVPGIVIPPGVAGDANNVHTTAIPTYPPSQHQDHRSFPAIGSPYGTMMWYQDGMPYGPRTGSSIPPPMPPLQQPRMVPPVSTSTSHTYQTRQSATHFPYGLLSKMMAPPPPYPGHSVAVASNQSFDPAIGYLEQRPPIPSPSIQKSLVGVPHSRGLDAGHPEPKPVQVSPSKKLAVEKKPVPQVTLPPQENRNSPFFLPKLSAKQAQQRKEKLVSLALVNNQHCRRQPLYGMDLVQAVTFVKGLSNNTANCQSIQEMLKSHEQRIMEMNAVINRFVFYIPRATSPGVKIHCSHPPPHWSNHHENLQNNLTRSLLPKFDVLHPITRGMNVQFPEARLIQYDCGKLQTLDVLLRELKVGKHRVLIFTQMTKMLDVLEKFLNYHGHVYLRLDGSTKVEQRQILMDRFNADTRIFCFILSTRSGGLGVNLTGADTVVFYDSDWNPTMDAQAQDRCHRIGQTRDVHIYRLVSERTVEENILKKANQKRLLGDIAIEGGNFTTAFLRETSLKELFTIDGAGGFEASLASTQKQPKPAAEIEEQQQPEPEPEETKKEDIEQKGKVSQNLFEQALLEAEDEQDACAATKAKAEEAAELAEFDEGIPYNDEASKEREEESSRVEQELMALESQLTPVERYAVRFFEMSGAYVTLEQIKEQEQVELAKKDWEMDHILALKEEEEKRAAEDEDEIFFTYAHSDSTQVYVNDITGEEMQIWTPPTPPREDKDDVYMDYSAMHLYETVPMPENQLPPLHLTKRYHSGKRTVYRLVKYFRDHLHGPAKDQVRRPASVFDRVGVDTFGRRRKDSITKKTKIKNVKQPSIPSMMKQTDYSQGSSVPEWLVHEDWALLQAVSSLQELPVDLTIGVPSQIPNWDIVSDIVNLNSRMYRSPRQCRDRYVNMVMPREEGKVPMPTLEDSLRKLKTKIKPYTQLSTTSPYPLHLKNKSGRTFRTYQLLSQDAGRSPTVLHSSLFDLVKKTASKRKPTVKQMLTDTQSKNQKHSSVLLASGIPEDKTPNPVQLASIKAERINREKAAALQQQQQQQQQQQAAQGSQQSSAQPQGQAQSQQQQQQPQQQKTNFVQPTGQVTAQNQAMTAQKLTTTTHIASSTEASPKTVSNIQGTTVTTGLAGKSSVLASNSGTPNATSIIINTAPGTTNSLSSTSSPFATINKRMQSQVTSLAQTALAQRSMSPTVVNAGRAAAGTLVGVQGVSVTQPPVTTALASVSSAALVAQMAARQTTTTTVASASHNLPITQQQLGTVKQLTPQQLAAIGRQRALTPQEQQQLKRYQILQNQRKIQLQQQQAQQQGQTTKTTVGLPTTTATIAGKTIQVTPQQQKQIQAALLQQQQQQQQQQSNPTQPTQLSQQQIQHILKQKQFQKLTPQQIQQFQKQQQQLHLVKLKQQHQHQLALQKHQKQLQAQQTTGTAAVSQAAQRIAATATSQAVTSSIKQGIQTTLVQGTPGLQSTVQMLVQPRKQVMTAGQVQKLQQQQQQAQGSQVTAQTVTTVTSQGTGQPSVPQVVQQVQQQHQVQQQQQQQQQHQQQQQDNQQAQTPYTMRLRNPPKH